MAIQVLEEQPGLGARFGKGLGEGLVNAMKAYAGAQGQQRKQADFQKALQNIGDVYGNSELNEQEKLIKAYQLMGGQFPSEASKLGSELSRLGMQQQKSFSERLQEEKRTKAISNIKNLYNDPDLSEEEKIFGVFQELSQEPALAKSILGSLQGPEKARGEGMSSQQFSKGYNAILEGNTEGLKSVLNDPKTSMDVKNKLSTLWNQQQVRKDVQGRELRARQTMVQQAYRRAVDSERKRISDPYTPKEDQPKIKERVKKLEALEKADLRKLIKNPDNYPKLHLWNTLDPEFFPEEEDFEEEREPMALSEAESEVAEESPEIQQRIEFLNTTFPPEEFEGKKKQDKAGRIYQSDGRSWQLQK